jgi:putative nucleotidyltransferase with HDIG domain
MEMTSNEALKLLESFRGKVGDEGWMNHSLCVGRAAGTIAAALGLDDDYAKTLGYIHDIGKGVGPYEYHDMNGYEYLRDLGYDEKYYNVCLTHSYLKNDIDCTAGGHPEKTNLRMEFLKNHEYTIYEKIINLCDLMCKDVVWSIEKRMIDLLTRKGVHDNTQYHMQETFKLKREFDDYLGRNVYDLFPEIKDNL